MESKAQAQQLTESNEQMAPQAKDAGKSERFLDLIKRRYFLLWDPERERLALFFFQIPYGFHRPFLDININLSEFLIGNNGGSMILWIVKPRYMTAAGRFQ